MKIVSTEILYLFPLKRPFLFHSTNNTENKITERKMLFVNYIAEVHSLTAKSFYVKSLLYYDYTQKTTSERRYIPYALSDTQRVFVCARTLMSFPVFRKLFPIFHFSLILLNRFPNEK